MLARHSLLPLWAVWALALAAGYGAVLLLYNGLLAPLGRVHSEVNTLSALTGKEAQVVETILKGGVGAVRVSGASGTVIYAAVAAQGQVIPQGQVTVLVRFEGGRAVVQPRAEYP
jgi:membrane protein implicated in regulation of membrane protease activity